MRNVGYAWFGWLLVGCGAAAPVEPVAPVVDCAGLPDVSWDGWAHGFFLSYCTACHSSRVTDHRSGAPVGVDFDTEAGARANAVNIRRVVLDTGTMPEGGGVQPDDLVLLDVWLACGG